MIYLYFKICLQIAKTVESNLVMNLN